MQQTLLNHALLRLKQILECCICAFVDSLVASVLGDGCVRHHGLDARHQHLGTHTGEVPRSASWGSGGTVKGGHWTTCNIHK